MSALPPALSSTVKNRVNKRRLSPIINTGSAPSGATAQSIRESTNRRVSNFGFQTVSSNASPREVNRVAALNTQAINTELGRNNNSSKKKSAIAIPKQLTNQETRILKNRFDRGIAPNVAQGRPSIRRPDGTVIGIDDEDLTLEEIEALQIISGQQATTKSLADQIAARRSAALLAGATAAEAQQFAVSGSNIFKGQNITDTSDVFINEKGEFGFGTDLRNRVNTELQQKQIRRNAARLQAAELAIKNQTTSGEAGELDNLKQILENAPNQDKPVSRILVSTDEEGNVVSPRNVSLQVENAALTGIDPDNFTLDVQTSGGRQATREGTNTPNVEQINQIVGDSIRNTLGVTGFDQSVVSRVGPDGELLVEFGENVPQELQNASAEQISKDLSSFFGGVGTETQNQIREDILAGEILNLGEIIPNFPEIGSGGIGSGGGAGFLDVPGTNLQLPIIIIVLIAIAIIAFLILRGRKQ